MNRFIVTIILITLFGCNQDKRESDKKKASELSTSIPTFELLEFKTERSTDNKYSWTYGARGTILTRHPDFQNVNLLLWLKYRDKIKRLGEQETVEQVLLSNGVGTIKTVSLYPRKDSDTDGYSSDPGPPQYEWQVVGYISLLDAKLTTDK